MNANAKKWVEALRSGDFHQAREMLRSPDNAYCCLGVACELYRREVGGEWFESAYEVSPDEVAEDGELPSSVRDWLGLTSNSGEFETNSLIAENDNGSTFAEIAAIIEREPKGLFA